MPQLDRLSWFTQIFWFILVFLGLYYFFVSVFLPQLVFSLKFRSKFLSVVSSINNQENFLRLSALQKQYSDIIKALVKSRRRIYILTRVRKLDFLEVYSVFLNKGKISRNALIYFIEGFKKLRIFYLRYKKS